MNFIHEHSSHRRESAFNCLLFTVYLLHLSQPTLVSRRRFEKYSSKLDISRLLFRIFAFGLDTFARCKKYSSKLDISRSFFRIFA